MCGILGLVKQFGSRYEPPEFVRALALLDHRGPDRRASRMVHCDTALDTILGACRLSILDLTSAGDQPMSSAFGPHHIVFNGEIFNYVELREELESLGCTFRSRSDTEVLLAAYAKWGEGFPARLIGMFAFAILDEERKTLFAARDHLGIKPFYYSHSNTAFGFASQISALLEVTQSKAKLHHSKAYEFLSGGPTDDTPETLFEGITQLSAGSWLRLDLRSGAIAEEGTFWRLPEVLQHPQELAIGVATEQLRALMTESVKMHTRSDVPVAAALSGGMDSSTIVCLMRKVLPAGTPIHTFTFVNGGQPGFDPSWNEERWADITATTAGATMHKVSVNPKRLPEDFPTMMRLQDGPFGSPVIWVQQQVFRAAHDAGFRAMMSGQGSDELMAGYRRHAAARMSSLLRAGKFGECRRLLDKLKSESDGDSSALMRAAMKMAMPDFIHAIGRSRPRHAPAWLRMSAAEHAPQRLPAVHSLHQMLRNDLNYSPLPALLRYEDRNSMAYSIDNRLPFLDPRLIDLVFSLPEDAFVSPEFTSKRILREAMRGIVPDAIIDRKDKLAFPVPVSLWLLDLRVWVQSVLDRAHDVSFLDAAEIQRTWIRFQQSGDASVQDAFLIWKWVFFLGWMGAFNLQY